MTEQPDRRPVEERRLDIERQRLAIEQHRWRYQQWLDDVSIIDVMTIKSIDNGTIYATAFLKSVFVLNGGALIAFPAFAQLAGIHLSDNLRVAISGTALFVVGLLCSAAGNALAFFGSLALTARVAQLGARTKFERRLIDDPEEKAAKWSALITNAKTIEDAKDAEAKVLRQCAIAVASAALAAFIAGTIVSGYFMTTTPRTIPSTASIMAPARGGSPNNTP